jgi:hypothetical protein
MAFFVLISLSEADFWYSKPFGIALLLFVGSATLCFIPMILAGMVCAAEIAEESEMKIRNKKGN